MSEPPCQSQSTHGVRLLLSVLTVHAVMNENRKAHVELSVSSLVFVGAGACEGAHALPNGGLFNATTVYPASLGRRLIAAVRLVLWLLHRHGLGLGRRLHRGSRASATGFLVPPALAPLPPLPDSYVVRLTLARGSAILEKVVCSFQGPDAATPKASERQSPNSTSKVDRGDVGVTCNGSTSSYWYCMKSVAAAARSQGKEAKAEKNSWHAGNGEAYARRP